MRNTSVYIGGASLKEAELRLIGELIVASYNAQVYDKMVDKKIKSDSSPLYKHSAYIRKAEALKCEAEQHRLLSCLYESTADRADIVKFLDEVFDLLK
jgi:hypothetical protein